MTWDKMGDSEKAALSDDLRKVAWRRKMQKCPFLSPRQARYQAALRPDRADTLAHNPVFRPKQSQIRRANVARVRNFNAKSAKGFRSLQTLSPLRRRSDGANLCVKAPPALSFRQCQGNLLGNFPMPGRDFHPIDRGSTKTAVSASLKK